MNHLCCLTEKAQKKKGKRNIGSPTVGCKGIIVTGKGQTKPYKGTRERKGDMRYLAHRTEPNRISKGSKTGIPAFCGNTGSGNDESHMGEMEKGGKRSDSV